MVLKPTFLHKISYCLTVSIRLSENKATDKAAVDLSISSQRLTEIELNTTCPMYVILKQVRVTKEILHPDRQSSATGEKKNCILVNQFI